MPSPPGSTELMAEEVGSLVENGSRKKQFTCLVSKINLSDPEFLATKKTPTLARILHERRKETMFL